MSVSVLIGQRGTGKTSLLRRLAFYLREQVKQVLIFDLDAEIEKREAQSIEQIFLTQGESYFRELEQKYFKALLLELQDKEAYIAVGGGFNVQLIPPAVRVVWLQRISERHGRIFLDRPSLNPELSPLEEFFLRAEKRMPLFLQAAWEEYLIPEGLKEPSEEEAQILLGTPADMGGILTLLPDQFATEERWSYFIKRRLKWGFDYFEIRDDLLNEDQIRMALRDIPKQAILWARRTVVAPLLFSENLAALVDYDRALVNPSLSGSGRVLSVHHLVAGETFSSLLQTLQSFERRGFHIKLAVEISTFADLRLGHQWVLENRLQRSFLPRSSTGKWLWYRLLMGPSQKIKFLKEGIGSAPDQPSLFQWLQRKNCGSEFAALLGNPVIHSFTPIDQHSFFAEYRLSVLPIEVSESEFLEAFTFLDELGLLAAAVTSPLKIQAYKYCQKKSPSAEKHGSVNTLVKDAHGVWQGHNTDGEGMEALFKEAQRLSPLSDQTSIAVWGGGGTLPLLKMHCPQAQYFSVQSGRQREGAVMPVSPFEWNPSWVVWAAGGLNDPGTQRPPQHWRPELVVDLNYREDSGGREFARMVGARYLSGETMFYIQAEYQRLFWRPFLIERCRDRKS